MTTTIQPVNRATWRELASGFSDYNYRQLWSFGLACAERHGATSEHVAIRRGETLLAAADVRLKSLPLLRTGIAYINFGPLARRGHDGDIANLVQAVHALTAEYVTKRGFILRIAPALGPPEWDLEQQRIFTAAGFIPAEHPPVYRTLVVDISRPAAEIRQNFGPKWRGHLNRAERNPLTLRTGTEPGLFAAFCRLYDGLLARKGFDVDLDAAFYARVQADLLPADCLRVSLALDDDLPVAGVVTSLLGDTAVYLLGANDPRGLQRQASYLLQWDTIHAAQQHGCRWYDLCGIDPVGNPGVYTFKLGMGGIERTSPGPFELRPSGLRQQIARHGERLYRAVRRRPSKRPVTT